MSECIIGLGNFSRYYLYILGTIIFRCFKDCIFGFISINPESKTSLFGFIPELSNHYLIQDFYRYLSFIIGGLLFMKITKMNLRKEDSELELKKNKNLKLKGLIHNKNIANSEKVSIFKILYVCLIYCLHSEIARIMYLFNFSGLDFWIFDVIFTLFFMDIYFIINYYKHKKYSMGFIIIINTILLLIASFLKNTDTHDDDNPDQNTYQIIEDIIGNNYSFFFIILIFIFLSIFLSFSRVKTKVLMHYNYISPYKIIFYTGINGIIITSIGLLLVSLLECKGKDKTVSNYCIITKTDENDNIKYYHDSIFIYIDELKNTDNYKFYLEIILIIPIFFMVNFFGFTCEILTIYYLNPLYVLVRENLYYFAQRFIFIFVNLDNYNKYISLKQFFILQTSEVTALLGYAVYLEIIELRFCNLDKDLKRKIMERAQRDTIIKHADYNDEDEDNSDFDESYTEEKNNNEDNKSEKEME